MIHKKANIKNVLLFPGILVSATACSASLKFNELSCWDYNELNSQTDQIHADFG